MDTPGLKNIRGTLLLMEAALTSHIEDATKEADRLRDSVDRDNSRDRKLSSVLTKIDLLENALTSIQAAAADLTTVIGERV